jgi:hypothetical protein
MKLTNYFLAVMLLFSISCNKVNIGEENNEDEIKPNQIEFDGQIYPLSWGIITTVEDQGVYSSNIEFYPSSVLYKANTGNLSGEGYYFQINEIVSTTLDKSGEYSFVASQSDHPEVGNFNWAEIFLDVSFPIQTTEDSGINSDIVVEANLEISHLYAEYEIIYNAKDDRGIAFSLYYKGSLVEGQ